MSDMLIRDQYDDILEDEEFTFSDKRESEWGHNGTRATVFLENINEIAVESTTSSSE